MAKSSDIDAYNQFLINLSKAGNLSDEKLLAKDLDVFLGKATEIRKEIDHFNQLISDLPIAMVVYLWVNTMGKNKVLGEKYLAMMWELIEQGVIPLKEEKTGQAVTIKEFKSINSLVNDHIRCIRPWSIEKRETLVDFYCEFSCWLSHQTFNFISKGIDYDREITSQRKIPFDTYLKFLIALEPRERILTKIFYLGGSVALEDVLSIKIEDLNFEDSIIKIGKEKVEFPPHLLMDIKEFIGNNKKGYIFRGRQNDRINHTVPYRALKTVAAKLGFGSDFTFKEFIKNQ